MALTVANIKEAGFLPGTMAPTVTYVQKGKGPTAQTAATTGVRMIVDRDEAKGEIFIQTCIPLNKPGTGSSWEVTEFPSHTVVAQGT
jgi:hypothetical protein